MVTVELLRDDGSTVAVDAQALAVIPAGHVVIAIAGSTSREVTLDGLSKRVSAGQPGLLALDLTRSTGVHRLEASGQQFWFCSEDAKLRLDGIVELLSDLRNQGMGWSGQFLFSDGSALRDPHVVYGWLDARADRVLDAIEAINRAPTRATDTVDRLRRRGGAGVNVARTLALLRSHSRENLAESPNGVVAVADRRYEPLRVVARTRKSTLASTWNARYVALLDQMVLLVDEVLASGPEPPAAARCLSWRDRIRRLARHPTARDVRRLAHARHVLAARAEGPELSDRNYHATLQAARDVAINLGWRPDRRRLGVYAFVSYADVIYQAWVATTLARILELTPTASTLGAVQPAYRNDRYDLYYDTVPKPVVLRSWRHSSNTPDALRPDLLLHDRSNGDVLLLDAKYRASGDRATEDSRKEVISYMASYGLSVAGIVYPPTSQTASSTFIDGAGQRLLELPLRPGIALTDDEIRDLLLPLFSAGSY